MVTYADDMLNKLQIHLILFRSRFQFLYCNPRLRYHDLDSIETVHESSTPYRRHLFIFGGTYYVDRRSALKRPISTEYGDSP